MSSETGKQKKYPFFVEWRMSPDKNGKINPGSVEERIARTINEIGGQSINPKYPAGSINIGTRTYCPVYAKTTYSQAEELAESGGGHLLVISNSDEKSYLEEFSSNILRANKTCWIGGIKKDEVWQWSTGESWLKLDWDHDYPKQGDKLQLVTGSELKVRDARSKAKAQMFIIEWSDDNKNVVKQTGSKSSDSGLDKVEKWHKDKVTDEIKNAEKKHKTNIKKLTFDLTSYLTGLAKNARSAEEDAIMLIHASVNGKDRIPETLENQGPSDKSQDITGYAVRKQTEIEEDLDENIEKLRVSYIKHLTKYRADMVKKGQTSIVKAIDRAIKNIGKDADSYRSHFE